MYKLLLLLLSFNYLIINRLNFQCINNIWNSKKQIKPTSKVNNVKFFENVNTLVISGGATYGLSYVSLLEKINEENSNIITKKIKSYSGSSVGALIATLLNFDLTLLEIEIILTDVFFNDVFNENIFKKTYNLFTKYGQNDGILVYNYINNYISLKKPHYKDITFEDLHTVIFKKIILFSKKKYVFLYHY